jgi:hypothetical protein
MFVPAEHGL